MDFLLFYMSDHEKSFLNISYRTQEPHKNFNFVNNYVSCWNETPPTVLVSGTRQRKHETGWNRNNSTDLNLQHAHLFRKCHAWPWDTHCLGRLLINAVECRQRRMILVVVWTFKSLAKSPRMLRQRFIMSAVSISSSSVSVTTLFAWSERGKSVASSRPLGIIREQFVTAVVDKDFPPYSPTILRWIFNKLSSVGLVWTGSQSLQPSLSYDHLQTTKAKWPFRNTIHAAYIWHHMFMHIFHIKHQLVNLHASKWFHLDTPNIVT